MSGQDDRLADGLDNLQGAAVQLIAAARAFLDVAEELVKDPGAAATMVQSLASLASAARAEWGRPSAAEGGPGGADPAAGGRREPRVQPIPLSDDG